MPLLSFHHHNNVIVLLYNTDYVKQCPNRLNDSVDCENVSPADSARQMKTFQPLNPNLWRMTESMHVLTLHEKESVSNAHTEET